MLRSLLHRIDPGRVIMAGVAAGIAYLLMQAADLRIFKLHTDDTQLLGRVFSANPRRSRTIGTAIHFINAIGLAHVYALVRHLLPGPSWLKGTFFALTEHTILWPISLLLDHYYSGRQDGTLARYNAVIPFIQGVLRHIAYGAVLGWLYSPPAREE